ncbi:antitoxin Xre-like helix-turn-helix domain-containing protein [Gluconacetobacter sp. Hr-1-5]|uniref:antitoxin Xre-like helix-turn-helix domain-containing protein n=1 Tax=Gluconacetobacter sp. Hr-1-5 TaxID=3395370 RepID=UPI003B52FFEF
MHAATKSTCTDGVDETAVALKAVDRIMTTWHVPGPQAARLCDMSESTWKRAKKPGFTGTLTYDQMQRLSALIGIYKSLVLYFDADIAERWPMLPNNGPLFKGMRPVDALIEYGLPHFLEARRYLDALRGGV